MGFRFRKSINLAGGALRVNLSKSGVGASVGGKGARITKKANGGTRTTTNIPGTGISYVSETKSKKKVESVMVERKAQAKREKTQAKKMSSRAIVNMLIVFAYIAAVVVDCAFYIAMTTTAGLIMWPSFLVLTIFTIVRAIVNGQKKKRNKEVNYGVE